jgi:hypothetical protein
MKSSQSIIVLNIKTFEVLSTIKIPYSFMYDIVNIIRYKDENKGNEMLVFDC